MGMRGPHRQPAELQKLHGNPSGDNIDTVNFSKSDDVLKPLVHLDNVAKKEWKRLAPELDRHKLLTEADIAAFGVYCASYSAWVRAEKNLKIRLSENGGLSTFTTPKGYIQQIPEIGIAKAAREHLIKTAREFGLTPSARNGLSAMNAEEDTQDDIFDFISRKNRKA